MNSIIRFRTAQKSILLCLLLSLVFIFAGCSSKDNEQKDESPDDSVKREVAPQPQEDSAKQEVGLNGSKEDIARRQQVREAYIREVTKLLQQQEKERQPGRDQQKLVESKQEIIDRIFVILDSMADSERKIEIIETLSEICPDSVVKIVDKALDDDDPEVRRAAMELLVDYELPDVLPVISKALGDEDEQTREAAVDVLTFVKDPKVGELLVQALGDSSESVRMAALEVAEEQEENVKLDVLKAAISSSYEEVKEDAVSTLIDVSNHYAMDILILGLKDSDAEFREEVNLAISFLISEEFDSYEEAKNWWDANRDKYDDELFEIDD